MQDVVELRSLVVHMSGLRPYLWQYPDRLFEKVDQQFIHHPWPEGHGQTIEWFVYYVDSSGQEYKVEWVKTIPIIHLKKRAKRQKDIHIRL